MGDAQASMPRVSIRHAAPGDEALILAFVKELAEYEHAVDAVIADEALLAEEIFVKGHAEVLFISEDAREVGFALFFHNFSTWLGRSGIYLEDLFVKPEFQGKGYGKTLLSELARLAIARNCGRLEWACLDWNQPSIDFYLSLGAKPMSEWTTYRLEGDTLSELANLCPDQLTASTARQHA